MKTPLIWLLLTLTFTSLGTAKENSMKPSESGDETASAGKAEFAYFGGGCFWCIEAVFETMDGVKSVTSGYQGGHVENPTYRQVCGGNTGHAEVVRVEFDPKTASYKDLVNLFFKAHDPTQLNRQGPDVGDQYRSVIFCETEDHKKVAESVKKSLQESGAYDRPIVTAIEDMKPFYAAEKYHQDYYQNNASAPYCVFNIAPKLKKLGLDK
jgi:peptide-methionine (S)-S-oxide reductase